MLARLSVLAAPLVSAALRAGLVTLLLLSFLVIVKPPTFGCVLEVCFTSCEGTGGMTEDWVLIGWCTGA